MQLVLFEYLSPQILMELFDSHLLCISGDHSDVRSMQSQSIKVSDNSYSNVLELTEIRTASQGRCQAQCMQIFGCVFYNYNKNLSACHFADPLGGSDSEKPEVLIGWNLYKIETLSINGYDEF